MQRLLRENCLREPTAFGPVARTAEPGLAAFYDELVTNEASMAALLVDPTLIIDADQFAACLDDLRAGRCVEAFDETCFFVDGKLGTGEACDNSTQCAGSRAGGSGCALPDEDAACGTCAPLPREGEACALFDECASGFTCSAATESCVPLPGEGEPCPDLHCASSGLICASATATCVPAPGPNEPCIDGRCSLGLRCTEESTCAPLHLPTEGEACAASDDCLFVFTDLLCDSDSRTCRPATLALPGETCDLATRYCVESAEGTNACLPDGDDGLLCTALPNAGAPCLDGLCSFETSGCDADGTCAALPGEDEPCPDLVCADGLACDLDLVCVVPTPYESCVQPREDA
jgi:hypothetical protein